MELIGISVQHSMFGVGAVAEQADSYVTVEFPAKTTSFVFPDAFEKFIKAEDIDVQAVSRT